MALTLGGQQFVAVPVPLYHGAYQRTLLSVQRPHQFWSADAVAAACHARHHLGELAARWNRWLFWFGPRSIELATALRDAATRYRQLWRDLVRAAERVRSTGETGLPPLLGWQLPDARMPLVLSCLRYETAACAALLARAEYNLAAATGDTACAQRAFRWCTDVLLPELALWPTRPLGMLPPSLGTRGAHAFGRICLVQAAVLHQAQQLDTELEASRWSSGRPRRTTTGAGALGHATLESARRADAAPAAHALWLDTRAARVHQWAILHDRAEPQLARIAAAARTVAQLQMARIAAAAVWHINAELADRWRTQAAQTAQQYANATRAAATLWHTMLHAVQHRQRASVNIFERSYAGRLAMLLREIETVLRAHEADSRRFRLSDPPLVPNTPCALARPSDGLRELLECHQPAHALADALFLRQPPQKTPNTHYFTQERIW